MYASPFIVPLQSDAGSAVAQRALQSGLAWSQQSLSSLGSQENEPKMAKVLYDYSVRTKQNLS